MSPTDTRLEATLRKPEPAIADDGFSESVMRALPRQRLARAKAGRWTLVVATAVGGLLCALFGVPLQETFGSLAIGGGHVTSALAVVLVALVAVPTIWAFDSERGW